MTEGKTVPVIELTEEQEKEGYWVEIMEDRVLVWRKKNQLALLLASPDIHNRVQELIERKRREQKDNEV